MMKSFTCPGFKLSPTINSFTRKL